MLSDAMLKLKDSLSCITYNGAQHTHIKINETDIKAKIKTVTLKASNGDWFSFDPDTGRKCKRIDQRCHSVVMSPLLVIGSNHKHHCACDCVVVINTGGQQLTVVYIDLKSKNSDGYTKQFQSTRQFVRYALGLLEEFHKKTMVIAKEHYVILHIAKKNLLNKTTTIPKFKKMGEIKPDEVYKLQVTDSAILYLKELFPQS
jgi:hypothetical protein